MNPLIIVGGVAALAWILRSNSPAANRITGMLAGIPGGTLPTSATAAAPAPAPSPAAASVSNFYGQPFAGFPYFPPPANGPEATDKALDRAALASGVAGATGAFQSPLAPAAFNGVSPAGAKKKGCGGCSGGGGCQSGCQKSNTFSDGRSKIDPVRSGVAGVPFSFQSPTQSQAQAEYDAFHGFDAGARSILNGENLQIEFGNVTPASGFQFAVDQFETLNRDYWQYVQNGMPGDSVYQAQQTQIALNQSKVDAMNAAAAGMWGGLN